MPFDSAASVTVLFIGNFLSSRGGSRSVSEELAVRLDALGWAVIHASGKRNRILRLADMVGTAWRERRRYRVAHVEVFSGPAFLWAEAACWVLQRAKKPFILTLHGGNLPNFGQRWPGRVRRLLQAAVAVTAPSSYLHQRMRPYREDIILLPNALDVAVYPYRQRTAPGPHLVWLRAFHAIYNPGMAVRVLAALPPETWLTMIGPDKDGSIARTRRLAEELGVAGRLTIVPGVPKSDVPSWLSRSDIFLNTTNVDNTPVSVLEAMACGLCVVSTNAGGIPYLLEDGRDALLVSTDDVAAMATAVRRLFEEPDLAARLSAAAREKVGQYDWSVILPQWEALFSAVASRAQQ